MSMKITRKQARFAEELVIDGNATAAAIRAGYNPNSARVTACRLLKANAAVQAAVQAEQTAQADRMNVNRDRVISELQEAIAVARAKGDAGAMIAGWREIGKICGYYQPERALRVDVNIAAKRFIDKLETMSDAELLEIVERNAAPPT